MIFHGLLIPFSLLFFLSKIKCDVEIDYNSGSKILDVSNHYVYRLFYDLETFEGAEKKCQALGGHLITITDARLMTNIAEGIFEHDLLDDESERFFWMGLQWNETWLFAAGNPIGWTVGKYSNWDDDPTPDENEEHCIGLQFYERGMFKWHPEKCDVKAPYICQYFNKKCLPWVEVAQGQIMHMQASKSNYGCPMYRLSMKYIQNQCLCQPEGQSITLSWDENSCDDTNTDFYWHNKVCVPGCHANMVQPPAGAILLSPNYQFFPGGRADYYCPGYFEYSGEIHPHNIFQVRCSEDKSFTDELNTELVCHRENVDGRNKDMQQLDAVVGHSYHLKCDYKGYPDFKPNEIVWYRNGVRIRSSISQEGTTIKLLGAVENWMLYIESLSEELCGVYMCVATLGKDNTKLVPGSVYNVSVSEFLRAQAALQARNDVIEKFAGYYISDGTYSSLHAYTHALIWADAHEMCTIDREKPEGHIAKVNGSEAFKYVKNLFSATSLDDKQDSSTDPDFYWVGDMVNQNSGKLLDSFNRDSGPILPVDDRVMRVMSGDQQCVGIRLNSRGEVELVRANCNRKAPYICSFFADQCLPPGLTVGSKAQKVNFACDEYENGTLKELTTDGCECAAENATKLRVDIDGHKSCNHEATWPTALCIPKCSLEKVDKTLGKLVTSKNRENYYKGMVITYFCAGHYEVDGAQYPQNSIEVVCDPGNGDDDVDLDIQCKSHTTAMEDDALGATYFDPNELKEVELHCEYDVLDKRSSPKGYVWMHNKDALEKRSPNQPYYPRYDIKTDIGSLIIQQPNKTSAGVYMCFADFNGLYVPGSVHKLKSKDAPETENTETTEDDSSRATNRMAFGLPILALYSVILCHVVPLLILGVLLC